MIPKNIESTFLRLLPIYLGVFFIFVIGITIGAYFPPGKLEYGPGLPQHLLTWDGLWYRDIAEHGYHWNATIGTLPARYQNVAFFPLYPLIERVFMRALGTHGWLTTIAPGIVFGLWSIRSFDRLAQRVLCDNQTALRATAFYAFWPATCFYFMGYATGLINLCVIQSMIAYVDGRFMRSAFWCGLGTTAGPGAVFVACGLCLDQSLRWMRNSLDWRQVPRLIGFGLLSVFGLLLFMTYLSWRFGNPLLFVLAQKAWEFPESALRSESLIIHITLMVLPIWYAFPFYQTISTLLKLSSAPIFGTQYFYFILEHLYQDDIDVVAVLLLFYILYKQIKNRFIENHILFHTGIFVLIGYMWFNGSTYNGFENGIRILYPALIIFLFLGSRRFRFKYTSEILLGFSCALACSEIALVWSGYMVI
ncbi:hypothetical protein ACOSOMT5_P1009 [Acidiphilium sp. MT5]